jgi:hypothetical protein
VDRVVPEIREILATRAYEEHTARA